MTDAPLPEEPDDDDILASQPGPLTGEEQAAENRENEPPA